LTGLPVGDGAGDDVLIGDEGRVVLVRDATLGVLRQGVETLSPEISGNDRLFGGLGDDLLLGGSGSDWLHAGEGVGNDGLLGDHGWIGFAADGRVASLNARAAAQGAADWLYAGDGKNAMIGGEGEDELLTGALANPGHGDADDVLLADHGRILVGEAAPKAEPQRATLSLNFNGGTSSTVVSGIAGADGVAADRWNNLGGGLGRFGDDPDEALLLDTGDSAAGVTVDWGANLDGSRSALRTDTHSQITPGGDPNRALYEGYLFTTRGNTLGVDLSGLAALFDSYEVYVYLDADNANSARGKSVIQVQANGENRYVDDAQGRNFQGQYQEATATDAASAGAGNYVRFSGLTGDTLNLRLDAITASAATRPMISGIQIVGTRAVATGSATSATAETLLSAADMGGSTGICVTGVDTGPAPPAAAGGDALLFDGHTGGFTPIGADDGDWLVDDGSNATTGMIAW
jgi:hypothetical protein